jgi:hypothetical protein
MDYLALDLREPSCEVSFRLLDLTLSSTLSKSSADAPDSFDNFLYVPDAAAEDEAWSFSL